MLITHRELFVILINNSPVSSWLDCCQPTKTTTSSTRREEIRRQGNTLFVNDSIKRSFINFYLNRRAKDRRERKKLTTSNRLTTSRCFMCCDWYNKNLHGVSTYIRLEMSSERFNNNWFKATRIWSRIWERKKVNEARGPSFGGS